MGTIINVGELCRGFSSIRSFRDGRATGRRKDGLAAMQRRNSCHSSGIFFARMHAHTHAEKEKREEEIQNQRTIAQERERDKGEMGGEKERGGGGGTGALLGHV
jgi:hypothetical protein